MTQTDSSRLRTLGIVTTLADAALAFYRGRQWSGLFLVVMAALSAKVTGLGAAGSLAVRLSRAL